MQPQSRVPVILLTGFLGSGKTTFLNRILKLEDFKNSLVIVNEFGSVPVDHLLVEQSAETIYELSNGCLCCNMRGELVETLASLDLTQFDRIFIETTGIADPLPVFQTLALNPDISAKLQPSLILSVFDLARGKTLIADHAEAQHQLAIADQILLTKQDIGGSAEQALAFLRKMNANAKICAAAEVRTLNDLTSNTVPKEGQSNMAHSKSYRSAIMKFDRRLSSQDLLGMLHMLVNQFGPQLLRIKGFAGIEESENPVIVQVSGSIVHDLEVSNVMSFGGHATTELVAITKDLDPANVVSIFDGFCGNMAIDAADKDALLNNPLAIPGA